MKILPFLPLLLILACVQPASDWEKETAPDELPLAYEIPSIVTAEITDYELSGSPDDFARIEFSVHPEADASETLCVTERSFFDLDEAMFRMTRDDPFAPMTQEEEACYAKMKSNPMFGYSNDTISEIKEQA